MPAAAPLPSGTTEANSPWPAVQSLIPGTEITANQRRYRIQSFRDLESVIAQDIETGAIARLPLAEISRPRAPAESALTAGGIDLCSVPDEAWAIARQRFEAIEPLLAPGASSLQAVAERAKATGKHRATLYRWMNAWLKSGTLTALLPNQPGAATGQKRLSAEVEEIISSPDRRAIPDAAEDHARAGRARGHCTLHEARHSRSAFHNGPPPNRGCSRTNQSPRPRRRESSTAAVCACRWDTAGRRLAAQRRAG
jgi:hypothetical protein